MIKLGADIDAQDSEGNTPLHLCVKLLGEDAKHFEQLKFIGKELLFSGASRILENEDGYTPLDMLEMNSSGIEEPDYLKMKYVLTQPKGIRFLQMRRPIEKVRRKNTL